MFSERCCSNLSMRIEPVLGHLLAKLKPLLYCSAVEDVVSNRSNSDRMPLNKKPNFRDITCEGWIDESDPFKPFYPLPRSHLSRTRSYLSLSNCSQINLHLTLLPPPRVSSWLLSWESRSPLTSFSLFCRVTWPNRCSLILSGISYTPNLPLMYLFLILSLRITPTPTPPSPHSYIWAFYRSISDNDIRRSFSLTMNFNKKLLEMIVEMLFFHGFFKGVI